MREDDPDFAATGFARTSYIHDEFKVPLLMHEFHERKGQLQGHLLARFKDYSGV